MKIAMIGLGKMGANMVRRLVKDGHVVLANSKSSTSAEALSKEHDNIIAVDSHAEMISMLESPRVIWMMVPHQYVDQTIDSLTQAGLEKGDCLVDGGNSNFNLSKQRAERLEQLGIHYVDSGTSGGIWGLENGYSLMVGGSDTAVSMVRPLLETLAPAKDKGWGHV
ncbi:NAD(P)-binding domain-containing protein, partial [Kaarinaea lacus]